MKLKKILIVFLCMNIIIFNSNINVFAKEADTETEETDEYSIGEVGGYLIANSKSLITLSKQQMFSARQGHGFAAEEGNNISNIYHGEKSTVVGYNNVKNGPDIKIINRNGSIDWIQSKYCEDAAGSINAAFDSETGMYKYTMDDTPMKLLVPSEQYEEAVERMAKKISEGKVPGVTDPAEASELVVKGRLTYQQAVNITKAGNIDSLKYDAQNGMIISTCAAGIAFAMDYALCRFNGTSNEEAIKEAGLNGIKTGGVMFATHVITSQLSRTAVNNAFMPAAEAIAKNLGPGVQTALVELFAKEGTKVTIENVAKVISKQMLSNTVLVVVLSASDAVDLFRGRISKQQFLKDLTITVCKLAGAGIGTLAGGAVGLKIASEVGGKIGGTVGGFVGFYAGQIVASSVLEPFFKDDSEKMYKILNDTFISLVEEYPITEEEANLIVDELKKELTDSKYKDMFQSKNRKKFARKLLAPLFEKQMDNRKLMKMPKDNEIRQNMKENLKGIVFVH